MSSSAARTMARAGRKVGPAPTVPRIAGGRNLPRTEWRLALARTVGAFGLRTVQGSRSDGLRARYGADRVPRPRGLPRRGLRRPARLRRRSRGPARRGPRADGARAPGRRRAPARRDLHAAGHHLRADRRGRPGQGPSVPARPRAADHPGRRSGSRSSAASRSASARSTRFVDDVYHAREIVREGIVPWRLVVSRSHFARVVHGIRPPGGVYRTWPAATWCATPTARGRCSRTTCARRRASPTCSRTAWR